MTCNNDESKLRNLPSIAKDKNDISKCEVFNWSDMRAFDNFGGNDDDTEQAGTAEQSSDWYTEEENKMALEHGGNFIRVTYVNDQTDYLCEICQIHSNSKTSLGIHCNGMKHLKKKKQWDEENKEKSGDTESAPISYSAPANHASAPPKKRLLPEPSRLEEQPRGYTLPPRGGRGYYERGPIVTDMERGHRPRSHEDYYSPYGRGSYSDRDKHYRSGSPRGRNDFKKYIHSRGYPVEEMCAQINDQEVHYGRSSDQFGPSYRPVEDSRRLHWAEYEQASNGRRYRDNSPTSHSYRQLNDKEDMNRLRSYPNPSSQRDSQPAPMRPPIVDILPDRFRDYETDKKKWDIPAPKVDKMPKCRAPSPPKVDLRNSSRSESLKQLANISVLSEEDVKTGINVVSSVLKSLKNFYQVKSDWKAVDLLIDAELKIGCVAALETTGSKDSPTSKLDDYMKF